MLGSRKPAFSVSGGTTFISTEKAPDPAVEVAEAGEKLEAAALAPAKVD